MKTLTDVDGVDGPFNRRMARIDRVKTLPIPRETMRQVIESARCPVCGALAQHDVLCPNATAVSR
jgi:hypothetical protein